MSADKQCCEEERMNALIKENEVLRSALKGMLTTFGGMVPASGWSKNEIKAARVALGLEPAG